MAHPSGAVRRHLHEPVHQDKELHLQQVAYNARRMVCVAVIHIIAYAKTAVVL